MAESNPEINFLSSKLQRGQTDKETEPAEIHPGQIYEIQGRKLHIEEMREIPLNLTKESRSDSPRQIHGCDICMAKSILTLSFYLCYVCSVYMCEKCLKRHNIRHAIVEKNNEQRERREKAEEWVLGMREEREVKTGEELDRESVEVIGRVNVKHGLDENDCYITGLSGLENKRWVAVDSGNFCIKIFCSVSNTLLRYIKFGSLPRDAAEITIQHKSTDPGSASDNKTNISGAVRDKPDKHCLLAITFPWIKQIWLIDVNKCPTLKTKAIKLETECSSIDFSEDKIFTLCEQVVESESRYSNDILSTEGDQLKVIQSPGLSILYISDLAVYKGRIYLSDYDDHKVLCMNVEDGKVMSKLTLEIGSWPTGITVDRSNNILYLCGRGHSEVYKLSSDLRKFEKLSLDTDYTEEPHRLCFNNNKLYIGHHWLSSLGNVVTVVHVLT